ncbi:MAG: glycine cleavage system aminomethyltransferase GcvT [Acidimicrobiales bacterium]
MSSASGSSLSTGAPGSAGEGDEVLRHSPLEPVHRELGAKLVPFGGWLMPLAYPDGTLAEHRVCRSDAVVFDVSHLGTVRVTGDGALALLQEQLTNDLGKIAPGRAQYTHLLDADDASVLDDIIVWWRAEQCFDVMPNASNTGRVLAAIGGSDVTAERVVLAVQGPEARRRLAAVSPDAAAVGRFRVGTFEFAGTTCAVAGTGYTGEDGVECAVPADLAARFWEAVTAQGVQPAGLGARDTLRLEAGLPLHGHELGPGITPLQAGLGWVVGWDKGPFRGREPLEEERRRGPARLLKGLVAEGRQPPRQDAVVMRDAERVGVVTSGNFSPVLGSGIAMAFIDTAAGVEEGDELSIDLRGRPLPARVAPMPFLRAAKGAP